MSRDTRPAFCYPMLSTRARGKIIHEALSAGRFRGTRRGVKIEIDVDRQKPAASTVTWRARIKKEWQHGTASNVTDAINQIGAKAQWL